jgi:hypothetical protein
VKGETYGVFDAGFPLTGPEKVLQLEAALPIPPDYVATYDHMSATLEVLIALLPWRD